LRYDERSLEYQNVAFDGPSALTASEQDSVYFEGDGKFTEVPAHFETGAGGHSLQFDGLYRHRWSLRCEAPALSPLAFTFDGKAYAVSAWNKQVESFQPKHIYLDLNEAWTQTELAKVRALLGRYSVSYATTANNLEPLTEENVARVFQQSRSLRFSLFPFYKIDDPEHSLVITKSAAPTPLPSELEGSAFFHAMNDWDPSLLRVFHLGDGDDMTAYLRALRERRDLFCMSGPVDLLDKYLAMNTFPQNLEGTYTVVIPASDLLIAQKDSIAPGKAPDHLFRLFAYNTVLKELGHNAVTEPEELVRLAEQAYVVTPVSSLVTLETKEDYERFDIKPTTGLPSLGNAGAVPEPHEWALIVLLTMGALLAWRGRI
jgi:XrtN system VIT domain protein